jgi:transcriptional regulator with XRE-family HTH domain
MTRAELARKSAVEAVTIWRIETRRTSPQRSTRLLIAVALGCDPAVLFPGLER